ncbi:sarcolemmal membrane-associated protein-like [Bradysia coprophila]|uniref:sarcolemmal membrane-associated protein-like n=1 Tax=Bradysia coprophila TaxID=38358 RepID=UPI00187D875F|nr:sarcolemmal membrane-associated protein-like [Bradysia coprophila]XP_037033961.1 sarcolemmal membrane-associated protein-like [Bradysia coprophila]
MVYVRKNLLDHEAAVLRQSNLTAKMNDTISLNNEGEVQQQPQNNQQNGSIVKQKPRALLLCQPNSHPFQPRNIVFDPAQEVKVGRSITRTKIADNNAVFDCKVLSRNHAVLWYKDGKFFLRDTGSSNGTFINSQRLSSNSTSSEPYEIRTDDIIQFGVDVMENNKKETHGCIVCLVKLFVPEGEECKTARSDGVKIESSRMIPSTDLCRLNQYLQEAIQREQVLETKLFNLQKIVETTRENSKSTWHAMIEEDRLLSRIDILENKLLYLQKNVTDDKLRDDMMKLLEEKCVYQNSAKEALRKIYQERNDAVQKLATMERTLCSSEDECSYLRDQLLKNEENLQTAMTQLATTEEIRCELTDQLQRSDLRESHKDLEIQNLYEQIKLQTQQYKETLEKMVNLNFEKDLLQERLKKLAPKRHNVNNTIMSWMENSNLAGMASGKNIMDAICNEDDNEHPSLSETHEKLLALEKQIASFEIQINGSDSTTESNNHLENEAPLVSDGNQNNQQSSDAVLSNHSSNNEESNNELNVKSLLKTTVNQLKEICEELCSQVVSMKSDADAKDKICADEIKSEVDDDEDDEEEDDEEEAEENDKCTKTDTDESRENIQLVSELQKSRRIIAELEAKLNAFNGQPGTQKVTVQTDTDELILLNAFNDSCETLHHASVENLTIRKYATDAVTQTSPPVVIATPTHDSSVSDASGTADQPTHIDSDKSQLDHSLPDRNLDVQSDSVADDMKMLCDPNIEREEQLIAFKERCAELTTSNLQLKNQMNDMQLKLSNGHAIISNRMAIIAPIAVAIICWLILPYL